MNLGAFLTEKPNHCQLTDQRSLNGNSTTTISRVCLQGTNNEAIEKMSKNARRNAQQFEISKPNMVADRRWSTGFKNGNSYFIRQVHEIVNAKNNIFLYISVCSTTLFLYPRDELEN